MDSDNDSDGANILNDLLSNSDIEENESTKTKTIKEMDYNFLDSISNSTCIDKVNNSKCNTSNQKANNSENIDELFGDNIDSSDDEDKRYFEKQKYSEYGRNVKLLLKKDEVKKKDISATYERDSRSLSVKSIISNNNVKNLSPVQNNVYNDPFFGIRIVNPLISSKQMREQMNGKSAITISKIKTCIASGTLSNDWVIAGVLINKSPTKTSQKGSSYSIWKISDLSENMTTVSIFLFSAAYKTFWKTTLGTVIGILNPNILESKDYIDQATLSIDTPQKMLIIGKSKDMGKCKSTKKNGEPCTSIVNINRCEFCIYHVKQEYKKCSKRADLGSNNNSVRGFSSDFPKSKSQQTSRIFNSNGMQPFVPIRAQESDRLRTHDQKRLALLSETHYDRSKSIENNKEIKKGIISVELQHNQIAKDHERINKLKVWNSNKQLKMELVPSSSQSTSTGNKNLIVTENKEKKMINTGISLLSTPRLGIGCNNGKIDFSQPITKRQIDIAKRNAIKWVQQNGIIKPKDPNKISLEKNEKRGTKRTREINEHIEETQESKKSNSLPNNFKELMETKSVHVDLIEKSYEEEKEKYFNKLEMKEKMEKKMLSTFKIECKAVICLICKYTAFSSSDFCKKQKHPIRVINAIKRFFKCSDCGNRTVSLEKLPLHSCTKCNSSNWLQAAMMDERKTNIITTNLSVRGGEEKFLGSSLTNADLNLLVPKTN
ncbi:protein MCM10 homolog isoform X2 [Vespa mandarinia]|uniref:protein MCM10 homolog isoform X2 n=2 Tax=Vespa mandarinia TaxID=7446 RepID=UPI00160F431B|nr:protein MCM10 homolog isoform X2 [Vespa mandarinia]